MRQSQPSEIRDLRAPIVLAHEQPFLIGDAEFHPATREVWFAGRTSIVEPRVMQLLIALHRAGGGVVNKDDLLQSCWDGRVVGEDAINRVISRLRAVLDKDAGRQSRIETITKVGYRLLLLSGQALSKAPERPLSAEQPTILSRVALRRFAPIAAVGLALLMVAVAAWLLVRPAPSAAHSMVVQLSGFRPLSPDLPAAMSEATDAEIAAAFNVDGVVGVSNERQPTAGSAPSYSLGGTVYRDGDTVRVVTRLVNDHSGVVLWSNSVVYPANQTSKIPHKIAVDAGTVVRCGLSGAATYRKPLPDPVLGNYMQYCQQYWSYGGSKTLRFAQRVVAALPDFSWGWSAVGNGWMQASNMEKDGRRAAAMRAIGRQAEDKALSLDRGNSEALAHKAYLIDSHDWVGQEALFKAAVAAKPLDCGCEHYGYGLKMQSVGRIGVAIQQFRAATDMLALWPDSQLALARTLEARGRRDEARPFVAAAIDLSKDDSFAGWVAVLDGVESGDYASAEAALRLGQLNLPEETRAALLSGYQALKLAGTPAGVQASSKATQMLIALPKDQRSEVVATMLGALGANREALQVAAESPWLFWMRSMRGVLREPAFPEAARQLGLMRYWRASRTRPDVCLDKDQPPFCRLI